MNCNCINRCEKQLINSVEVDGNKIHSAIFDNINLITSQTISLVELRYRTKNGKERKKKMPISHNYCPFCGKKYEVKKVKAATP